MAYQMALGAGMDIAGTILGGKEADRVAKILRNLPEFQTVDITGEQGKTVTGNLQSLGEAKALTSQVNEFNTGELLKAMRGAVPKLDEIQSGLSDTVLSQMKGELTQGEKDALTQDAAERAVVMGTAGSPYAEGARLFDLRRARGDRVQQGIQSAMQWLGTAKATMVAPQMNVASMFLTPEQRIQAEYQNRVMKYQSDMNRALGKTAPGLTGYYANNLKRVGGQLMGGGFGMNSFGGGTPSSGYASGSGIGAAPQAPSLSPWS